MTLIKLASDETLVGLERIQEPSEDLEELLEGEEGAEGVELDAVEAADDDAGAAEEAPQE